MQYGSSMQAVDILAYAAVFLALANVLEVAFLSLWARREIKSTKETIAEYASPENVAQNAQIIGVEVGNAIDAAVAQLGEGIADAAQDAMLSFAGKKMAESGKDANAIDSALKVAYREAGVNNMEELLQSAQSGQLDLSKIMGGTGPAGPGQALMNPMQLIASLLPKKYRPYVAMLGQLQGGMPAGGGGQPALTSGGNSGAGNLW